MHRRVAIIAYSLRFPGTDTLNFWNDLLAKKDLVTAVDSSRWSQENFLHPDKRHPGTSYTFAAGSIGDISGFDASFFGISPREAALMDPQQRLLLELAWETFENAGIVPSSLRGSDCGVFIGISNVDYAYRLADDLAAIDSAAATGIISSIAANRISYLFDLHGPSISMDTACSSSLVAFHQACQSIRTGEISKALVGGINLHLHPYGFISFSKATMLSKTGRCHVFDESGDGYVRSEGGGLFLLKDYDQAIADGDPILAVVAGSAVNTDGNKSGLTIPNPKAQAALMSGVYAKAGIDPEAIDYFEAHGTGTAVGDPIETQAIGQALGQKRRKPLLIGSVKSNLGHLESASGVAGLVKALNCIQHRAVPATIGIKNPNHNIKFDEWNIRAVTETLPLKAQGKLIVGINSFGFGGANAHVILESPSEPVAKHKRSDKNRQISASALKNTVTASKINQLPLLLSAKESSGLTQAALELADFLERSTADSFYDIAHTAFFRRERHLQGAVVFTDNANDAALKLRNFVEQKTAPTDGTAIPEVYTGVHLTNADGPAFVYSGNGCQWEKMGKQLLEQSATFRRTITEIDKLFSQYGDFSLIDELAGRNGEGRYQYTEIAQPALFALQVGITEFLRENGVSPIAVVGHSVGEVAAAWASGALSLAEAVKVIFYRSYYQGKTKGSGQMTAVGLGEKDIQLLLDNPRLDQLCVAGLNSYRGVTIAGSAEQLSLLEADLEARNAFFRRLDLDYAFHSPAMDTIESGILLDLAQLKLKPTVVPYFSTVTGRLSSGEELGAEYWWRNIRQPVQFKQAIDAILDTGVNTLIEIGAHPVLQSYLNDGLKARNSIGLIIPTAIRKNDSAAQLMNSVAQAIISGILLGENGLTMSNYWFPVAGRLVNLPNYPWQREKLWHPVTSESLGLLTRKKCHPLLGYPLQQHDRQWENQLDTQLQPFLNDHNVGGAVVFPGAGFAELALAAAHHNHPDDFLEIEELEIRSPLLLSHDHSKVIRFTLDAADGRFTLVSRENAGSLEWTPHLVGRVLSDATGYSLEPIAPAIPDRAPDFDKASHALLTESVGLEYGPAFQAISYGWSDQNSALGIFELPASISVGFDQYYLHPALLDCAFQLVFQILKDELQRHDDIAFVPIKMGKINLRASKAIPHLAKATLLHRSPHSLNAEFALYDANGLAIAIISDVRFRAVRLHRQHALHPHYLDTHLTASPLFMTDAGFKLDQAILVEAIEYAQNDLVSLRYSEEVEPLLDSLCGQFIFEALSTLANDSGFLSDTVINDNPQSALLFQSCLAAAIENQTFSLAPGGCQANPDNLSSDLSATAIWNTLVQEYPDYFYLIHLTGRVGMQLPGLLSGDFQAENLTITPSLYATITSRVLEQTGKKTLNDILFKQLRQIIDKLPIGERLSILEIGSHQPEFAALLCSQLDFKQSDYCFASLCDDALNSAEALRERFPLLQVLRLSAASDVSDERQEKRANFAIVNLNMGNVDQIQQLFKQLPALLMPDSPVLLIGQQPARWIDNVLGIAQDWWIARENQPLLSPQLSAELIAEQLQSLNFKNTQIFEMTPDSYSGAYLMTTIAGAPVEQINKPQNWLIMAGDCEPENTLAKQIIHRLQAEGHSATKTDQRWTLPALLDGYDQIIHLSGFGQADVSEQTQRCWLASEMIQACEAVSVNATLWLLTHNVGSLFPCDQARAFLASGANNIAHDAALWGLGRTLMNEATNYRVRLLDISGDIAPAADSLYAAVLNELLYNDNEQEVILNPTGKRFAPRLRSRDTVSLSSVEQDSHDDPTLQLGFKLPGQLRNLQWRPISRLSPADDEIEIEVKATGLNFRDIMYTLGLLSDEAVENGFVGPTLGLEFAGIVTRTGAQVTAFKPGDQVVGLGPASFSNRVLTKANAIAAIPNNIGYAAAATIPSTFFTVYYALHYQARLQPGEKILIHGAAGGVGIAAIQIARWLGAEIYATVGSDEKRDFLRLLGIEHIHDSRSLSFAEEILAKTGNRGVDVILNSLAGEAINRNFHVLKPFGRFLELGKRDFYENTHIGLRPFRNNISYFGIDADQLMQERPELTRQLFNDMMKLFHDGVLHPLPYTTFDAHQVIDAFRYMQQARQIGKVVITYDNGIYTKPAAVQPPKSSLSLSSTASYLVTGGLGGFGLRTAQWLAEKGARHLVLISRSGPVSTEAKAALADFAEQGVNVYATACDVTEKSALESLVIDCAANMPPLKGIVHAATVIDDGLTRHFSREQIQRVLEPKVLGAHYLHELTLDKSLDLFVLYSSVTTLFGNPGQGNYVAANLWLEALAAYRRQQGLPATCVCFGAIDDVGFLARNEKIKDALQSRIGGAALSSSSALATLEQMIMTNSPTLGVTHYDWRALSNFLPTARAPKFHELASQAPNTDSHDDHRADIKRLLEELSDEDLKTTFIEMLKEELSQILLVAKEKINADHSMYDMGLDSLMGVELMIAIESRFDVQIPVMALSEAPTLNKLADRLIASLRGETQSETGPTDTQANISDLSRRHGSEVSQDQLDALTKTLESSGSGKIITH
ncbi:MAG: SDR family NAD(P)-dependent oxidoreductase [Methylococcaceae bacterium]